MKRPAGRKVIHSAPLRTNYTVEVWQSTLPFRQRWRWTVYTLAGEQVANSGEFYKDESHAIKMVRELFPEADTQHWPTITR